jgi:hypothetical protein
VDIGGSMAVDSGQMWALGWKLRWKIEIFDAGDMDVELQGSQLEVSGGSATPDYVQSYVGSVNCAVNGEAEGWLADSCLESGRKEDTADAALGSEESGYVEMDIGTRSR